MRAFLGIALPKSVQESLAALQGELATSRADVKWVEPANLHLTLRFLDEISDAQCHAIEALLARIATHEEPFSLRLEGVGAFPSVDAPRVIWVGLAEGREVVARMAAAIEQEGAAIPLRREERPFSSHLTLGRVRSPKQHDALTQRLRTTMWQLPPPWRVSKLTLYQSVLSPAGPRYTVLADIPLAVGGQREEGRWKR